MAYPRIQGLRMFLWKERQGETIDLDRCKGLIRELLDLAEQTRRVRLASIEASLAALGPDEGAKGVRLRIQRAVLASRSVFDDLFDPNDLDLFKTNDTYDRLRALYREVADR